MRPLPVEVGGDEMRHDIRSADVTRVFPDLPPSPRSRNRFVRDCDERAYDAISAAHPGFTPPSRAPYAKQSGAPII